ncbi:MAG: hypothetical protein HC882_01460 [Acidobacteria bacterium]|nr:hypothetical protein [Acidobacteriota bacterium]
MRPDEMILLWDPQMPRWSFWCRSKHPGAEEGYARVWIVGEQEASARGRAVDLDERAEYYQLMGTMGPFRLPEKDEIDRVLGEIATLGPWELDAYFTSKEEAAEREKERQFDDFTMDYLDHRSFLDAWLRNGGIRTWCVQAQWLSDEERRKRALERAGKRELDRGTYKVVVKKGSRFEEAELDDMRREAEARSLTR